MKFYYEAFTRQGQPRKGEIEASSQEHASEKIRELDLFPRQIEEQPFAPKFDHQATNPSEAQAYDPDTRPEAASMRLKLSEDKKKDTVAIPRAEMEREANWRETLKTRLVRISEAARQMEAWRKAASELKEGDDVPKGHPNVGGGTWKAYDSYKVKIVADLIHDALKDIMEA
jgi:hypothetical protein